MLAMSAAGGVGLVFWRRPWIPSVDAGSSPAAPKVVSIVEYSDAGARQGVSDVMKVVKTESEWRRQLTPIEFEITRRAGTERPFSGATWNLHDKGVYRCVCCGEPLFSSDMKFDSGTGWPSFSAPAGTGAVSEHDDRGLGMRRTEVRCAKCEAHLGHAFPDGPGRRAPAIASMAPPWTLRAKTTAARVSARPNGRPRSFESVAAHDLPLVGGRPA
jgi:peptide-methionine (R)-S-oxide reductase